MYRGSSNSPFVLGTWHTVGQSLNFRESETLVKGAYESGVRTFDTADTYGDGKAERFLGEILSFLPREEYVIATKCFFPTSYKPGKGLSANHLQNSVDHSLRHLRTDYIDVLQCHRFDEETPLEETISCLGALIDKDKIRGWAICRWNANQMERALVACDKHGIARPLWNQIPYNPFRIREEGKTLEYCLRRGMPILAYSVLAQGVLTGKYAKFIPTGSRADEPSRRETMWDFRPDKEAIVTKFCALAGRKAVSPAQMAIAWCLGHSAVKGIVLGASRLDQFNDNLKAGRVSLSREEIEELEGIFP